VTGPAKITFGFPEFWNAAVQEFSAFFKDSETIVNLVNTICSRAVIALETHRTKLTMIIYPMVRANANTFTEVVTLVGNGCGLGAMRLSRSMFESCVFAEYLRRNPAEVDDFRDYGFVLAWKRYQQLLKAGAAKAVEAKTIDYLEQNFKRVEGRFRDKNGRLRNHWHKKSIAQMATELDMRGQYELAYSLASSIHHTNFEGLRAQMELQGSEASIQQPPSIKWLGQALTAAHSYLLQALDTLNACLKLGFDNELAAAEKAWHQIWTKKP
jgi:hypothetical protein